MKNLYALSNTAMEDALIVLPTDAAFRKHRLNQWEPPIISRNFIFSQLTGEAQPWDENFLAGENQLQFDNLSITQSAIIYATLMSKAVWSIRYKS